MIKPGDFVKVNPEMHASQVGLCPLPDQWEYHEATTWVEWTAVVLLLAVINGWALILNSDGRYGWAEIENWVSL